MPASHSNAQRIANSLAWPAVDTADHPARGIPPSVHSGGAIEKNAMAAAHSTQAHRRTRAGTLDIIEPAAPTPRAEVRR